MTTFPIDDTERLALLNTKAFTEELLKNYYPQLFLLLNQVGYRLQELKPEMDLGLLQSVHQKMNEELDEIYRKEKLVLFPFLLKLEEEQKTSDSCKPFKNVKYHYTYLVSTTQQFKTLLAPVIKSSGKQKELKELKETLLCFERFLIKIQISKENYLFRKFRNCCASCKSLQL